MTIPDDSELRRRFAQLRESDRERTPGFAQTCSATRARRRGPTAFRVWPLAAGLVTAAALAAVWLTPTRTPPAPLAPAIADWRAPTDFLLRTPGGDVLGAMPVLGASVLDTMMPLPFTKGA